MDPCLSINTQVADGAAIEPDRGVKWEVGSWQWEVGSWKSEVGSWKSRGTQREILRKRPKNNNKA